MLLFRRRAGGAPAPAASPPTPAGASGLTVAGRARSAKPVQSSVLGSSPSSGQRPRVGNGLAHKPASTRRNAMATRPKIGTPSIGDPAGASQVLSLYHDTRFVSLYRDTWTLTAIAPANLSARAWHPSGRRENPFQCVFPARRRRPRARPPCALLGRYALDGSGAPPSRQSCALGNVFLFVFLCTVPGDLRRARRSLTI